jgi:hypothetical protein
MGQPCSAGPKKMENHPPKLIERIVGALVPPACREHVLGDWYERYTSLSQYLWDATTTLPFIRSHPSHVGPSRCLRGSAGSIVAKNFFGRWFGAYVWLCRRGRVLLFVIAFPLLLLLFASIFRQPLPQALREAHLWLSLGGLVALCISWFYVKKVNDRAARTIQREIDALDPSDKKH